MTGKSGCRSGLNSMVNYGGAPNIENMNCTCANLRSSDDCRHWVSQIVHVTVSLSDDRDMLLAGHIFLVRLHVNFVVPLLQFNPQCMDRCAGSKFRITSFERRNS